MFRAGRAVSKIQEINTYLKVPGTVCTSISYVYSYSYTIFEQKAEKQNRYQVRVYLHIRVPGTVSNRTNGEKRKEKWGTKKKMQGTLTLVGARTRVLQLTAVVAPKLFLDRRPVFFFKKKYMRIIHGTRHAVQSAQPWMVMNVPQTCPCTGGFRAVSKEIYMNTRTWYV